MPRSLTHPKMRCSFFIFLVVLFIGCKGNDGTEGINGVDGVSDKQIRLKFLGTDVGTSDTTWTLAPYQTLHLIKFDKRNYVRVDSIIFTCSLYTPNSSNTAYAELYDLTDSSSILNSQVQSNMTDYLYFDSRNIFASLPNKEIVLAVRVRSQNYGAFIETGLNAYLFLYRK